MKRALFILVPMMIRCGGQTAADIPASASDFPAPAADAVPYDSRLGALADVTGGRARIGGWSFDTYDLFDWAEQDAGLPAALDLSPLPCSSDGADASTDFWTSSAEVIVAPFRLMTTEVTNREYAICVDDGACAPPDIPRSQDSIDWQSPEVANQPVLLTWSLANAFCRHYGGALPTAGEYARATVGDADTYAQPSVLSTVLQCAIAAKGPNPVGAECKALQGDGPLADVGTDPNDVGPFGHFDLYGNAWEWARGIVEPGLPFCTAPVDEHDLPLISPATNSPDGAGMNTIAYSPANQLAIPNATSADAYGVTPDLPIRDPQQDFSGLNFFGFRCAFPIP